MNIETAEDYTIEFDPDDIVTGDEIMFLDIIFDDSRSRDGDRCENVWLTARVTDPDYDRAHVWMVVTAIGDHYPFYGEPPYTLGRGIARPIDPVEIPGTWTRRPRDPRERAAARKKDEARAAERQRRDDRERRKSKFLRLPQEERHRQADRDRPISWRVKTAVFDRARALGEKGAEISRDVLRQACQDVLRQACQSAMRDITARRAEEHYREFFGETPISDLRALSWKFQHEDECPDKLVVRFVIEWAVEEIEREMKKPGIATWH